MDSVCCCLFAAFCLGLPTLALSQSVTEEPTDGIFVPGVGLSGDFDAVATVNNPGGLCFVKGKSLVAAASLGEMQAAYSRDYGFGLFFSGGNGCGQLHPLLPIPKLGFGLAIESLLDADSEVSPQIGSFLRLTGAISYLHRGVSFGLSWHHFSSNKTAGMGSGASVSGANTFDIGLAFPPNKMWSGGFVVRDVLTPTIAGASVQRRYEAEVTLRPNNAVALSVGGRVGETRGDVDGWVRMSWAFLRGWKAGVQVETSEVYAASSGASDRSYTAHLGISASFGKGQLELWGSGSRGGIGSMANTNRARGGSLLVRTSSQATPSVFPERPKIVPVVINEPLTDKQVFRYTQYIGATCKTPHVKGIAVTIGGISGGMASFRELRQAFVGCRQAGKWVHAFMTQGGLRHYYLASAADQLVIDEAGGLRLVGWSTRILYFKQMLEMIGIEAQIEKIEQYKSTPESFTEVGPSEAAKEMRESLVDSLYERVVSEIAKARRQTVVSTKQWLQGGPYTASDVMGSPFVDAVRSPKDATEDIQELWRGKATIGSTLPSTLPTTSNPVVVSTIAVIEITGDIVDGDSRSSVLGRKMVGAQTIVRTLSQAIAMPHVAAIVLRINSPGGSALASEQMFRVIEKLGKQKPIVCSMGDIAASGGYFVAAGCGRVFADPMTITGSIGIFTGKANMAKFWKSVGISWFTVNRGPRADMDSAYRSYTEEERKMIKQKLRYYYYRFVDAVAKGRGMTRQQVDAVAKGRVWTGDQALQQGLVDELGGLQEAIGFAADSANIRRQTTQILWLPKQQQSVLDIVSGKSLETSAVPVSLTKWFALLPGFIFEGAMQWQARLPFVIDHGVVN